MENNKDKKSNVAFVTGYVGLKATVKIPRKPENYDGYFITNNKWVYYRLKLTKWTPIYIENTISELFDNPSEKLKEIFKDIKNIDKVMMQYFFTQACKFLKLFPQTFLPKNYDYIVWFDNKFNVNVEGTIKTIRKWDPKIAMMLHKHPYVKNIKDEFNESMDQGRYILEKENYLNYIDNCVSEGFSAEYNKHYQCGYLLYNMNHSETESIQKKWNEHIQKCGINDQISFNFVAQMFEKEIAEYIYEIYE